MSLRRPLAVVACLLLLTLGTVACGGDGADEASEASTGASSEDDGRLRVATTVAPITSIVANIGGERVDITGIVPEGTNSHTFEPKPSVAELLASVDVVYLNGLVLEEPTKELAEANLRDGAEVVELGTLAIDEEDYLYDFSFPEEEGKPNPHLWTDPTYALEYARIVAADLSERDPDGAEYYEANLEGFSEIVDELDARCARPSPPSRRATRSCSPTTTPTRTSPRPTTGR
jgi:ABC-type Zn uptake system ZnuABC Zn-binding protein ZnuA